MRNYHWRRGAIWTAAAVGGLWLVAGGGAMGWAQRRGRHCPPPCECPTPAVEAPAEKPTTPPSPEAPVEEAPEFPEARFAALSGDTLSVPNMMGDFPGGGCPVFYSVADPMYGANPVPIEIMHPALCGRTNLAENNSPLPRDRAYFRYEHFHNFSRADAFGFSNELPLDRFMVGLERTFFNEMMSVELRVPAGVQLASDLEVNELAGSQAGPITDTDLQWGNIAVLAKVLIAAREWWALSGGLAVTAPTAEDVHLAARYEGEVGIPISTEYLLTVHNDIVNLTPFVALLAAPSENLFFQGFLQIDLAAGSHAAKIDQSAGNLSDPTPRSLGTVEGELEQQSLLRLNTAIGYWLYRDDSDSGWLRGLAGLLEVHYTATLDTVEPWTPSVVVSDDGEFPGQMDPDDTLLNLGFGTLTDHANIVNMLLGVHADVGDRTSVATGVVLPLTKDHNRAFDVEFSVQINRYY